MIDDENYIMMRQAKSSGNSLQIYDFDSLQFFALNAVLLIFFFLIGIPINTQSSKKINLLFRNKNFKIKLYILNCEVEFI